MLYVVQYSVSSNYSGFLLVISFQLTLDGMHKVPGQPYHAGKILPLPLWRMQFHGKRVKKKVSDI